MDNEKLKAFLVPIMLLVVTLGGVGYLAPQILLMSRQLWQLKQEIVNKTTTLQEKQARLDELKRKEQEQESQEKMQMQENHSINQSKPEWILKPLLPANLQKVLQLVRAK